MKEMFKKVSRTLLAVAAFVLVFGLGANDAKAYGLTQSAQTQNSVNINWANPFSSSKYTKYIINNYYFGISAEDSTIAKNIALSKATPIGADQTSYTVAGLAPGTRYYVSLVCTYTRKSYDTKGKVTKTEVIDGYSVGSLTIKTLPGKVTGVNQDKWYRWALSCYVGWNEQNGVSGYEYKWMDHRGKVLDQGTSYGTSFSKPIKNYNVYKAQVRAYSTINGQTYYGDWSDEAYFFTQPSKSDKDAVVGAKVSGSKLKVNWKKMNGVSGYNVYVSTKKDSGYKKVKTVKANKGSVTVSKLGKKKFSKGKTYYIYVQAYKKVGGSTFTTGVNYITVLQRNRTNFIYSDSNGTYK